MIYVAYDDIAFEDDGNRIRIRNPTPYGMEDFYYSHHLPAIFMGQPDKFKIVKLQDAIKSGVKFLYALEFYSTFHAKIAEIIGREGDFRLGNGLDSDLLEANRQGKCVIIFSDAAESRSYEYKSENGPVYIFDFIARFVIDNELSPNNVWIVSGNPNGQIEYEVWRSVRGISDGGYFNFAAENISQFHLRSIYNHRIRGFDINIYFDEKKNISQFQKFEINFDRDAEAIVDRIKIRGDSESFRSKMFINFNNNVRSHRQMFVALLQREGLIDRGYVSFRKSEVSEYTESLMKKVDLYNSWKIIKNQLPLNVDLDNHKIESNFQTFFPRDKTYNHDSYFNFVSETWFFEMTGVKHTHITEKSIHSMLNFQPFIIVGRSHALRTLRQYGYWTFSDFWDESYDESIDNIERFEKIIKTISHIARFSKEEFRDIYNESIPILRHNFRNFINGPLIWDNLFKEVSKMVEI